MKLAFFDEWCLLLGIKSGVFELAAYFLILTNALF